MIPPLQVNKGSKRDALKASLFFFWDMNEGKQNKKGSQAFPYSADAEGFFFLNFRFSYFSWRCASLTRLLYSLLELIGSCTELHIHALLSLSLCRVERSTASVHY